MSACRRCGQEGSPLDNNGVCYVTAECYLNITSEQNDQLRAEVRDLKARLRAARRLCGVAKWPHREAWEVELDRATDLRVRDWRKP